MGDIQLTQKDERKKAMRLEINRRVAKMERQYYKKGISTGTKRQDEIRSIIEEEVDKNDY